MHKKEINELLDRYLAGECSEEEIAYVETWYNRLNEDAKSYFSEEELEKDLKDIYKHLPKDKSNQKLPVWIHYAAAVIVVICVGLLYNLLNDTYSKNNEAQVVKFSERNEISPGRNKATLTLADGKQVYLDDVTSGFVTREQGNLIYKNNPGQITYENQGRETGLSSAPGFNTIRTPQGGQYNIVLADGTRVWLNAASSLKYPTVFTDHERVVELTGEGYFEVAKNHQKPFKVVTDKQIVEVLGTHFNINSYKDEPLTRTTLLEGAVKVIEKTNHKSVLLKPGEQASVGINNQLSISKGNTNEAIAWKRGLFSFQNASIGTVMRQFSRWYDIAIEFEGKAPDFKLSGEIYRDVNASQALEILTYFDLKYRIEESNSFKKVIIYESN